jgi:hypothetical protein
MCPHLQHFSCSLMRKPGPREERWPPQGLGVRPWNPLLLHHTLLLVLLVKGGNRNFCPTSFEFTFWCISVVTGRKERAPGNRTEWYSFQVSGSCVLHPPSSSRKTAFSRKSYLWPFFVFFFFLSVLPVLGFKLRASWVLGRHSTTWAMPPVHFAQVILEMGVFCIISHPQTIILQISASQEARIIGMSHQHLASFLT